MSNGKIWQGRFQPGGLEVSEEAPLESAIAIRCSREVALETGERLLRRKLVWRHSFGMLSAHVLLRLEDMRQRRHVLFAVIKPIEASKHGIEQATIRCM